MNLKIHRIKKGLDQKEVAKICGVHPGTVSQWERGLYPPTGDHLLKLKELFGITDEEIREDQRTE